MIQLGERLAVARRQKGLSLADVEDSTKIRRRYIEAIEIGLVDDLPDPAYVTYFIRTYARFLDLNENEIVEEYREIQARTAMEAAPQAPAPEPKLRVTGKILAGVVRTSLNWIGL